MIRDYQAIMKTWFPKGKQRIIPTYGKHEGVKLVGILDYETGHVYVEEHKKIRCRGIPAVSEKCAFPVSGWKDRHYS